MSNHISQGEHTISLDTRSLISSRYQVVTKASNMEFWNSSSATSNSRYVGSYGRGTAIDTSDLDIMLVLPNSEYDRFNSATGNEQSRLLQAVRGAVRDSYPRSDVRADGQVVKINFSDGMKFELLPAFKHMKYDAYRGQYWDKTYIYADSNDGGHWKSTNPLAEQESMEDKNNESNGLLFDTCKHMRWIRDNYYSSYHLSGITIDTFAYYAIGSYHWKNRNGDGKSSGQYENDLLQYFENNSHIFWTLRAPGSGDEVRMYEYLDELEKVLNKMTD